MDRDDVAFPDASEIASHAIAFAQMMFAHAAFEREVRALQDAITNKPGFGEHRDNRWRASDEGTEKIISLITKHRGDDVPQIEQVKNLLTDAVHLCKQRNFLAHGTWWCFNGRVSIIKVRGGIRWEDRDLPPQHRDYAVSDIEALTKTFQALEAELFKVRRSFEPEMTEAEVRAAFSFLRAPEPKVRTKTRD